MDIVKGDKVELDKIDQVIVSKAAKEVFDFVWKIENFPETSHTLMSPVFTSPITKTEWRPNVRNDSSARIYIGLRLCKAQTRCPVTVAYNYYFLNSENKVHKGPYPNNHNFTRNDELHEVHFSSATSFMDVAQGYLAQDRSLSLLFRVTTATQQKEDYYGNAKESKSSLNWASVGQESLKSFLDNGEFVDLTLSTKTKSFQASKVILAAQSPVFKAMFLSDMLESKENVVKIEDFSDETVKGFLEFLYTGQSESLKENAVELLKISDKYEVLPLKKECEKILMENLNKENAADLLILAHFYNSAALTSKLVSFVKKCGKEFADTESFKQHKKLHPEIFLDLYTQLV